MTAAFVTATGTGIGKTFVAAGLLRHWRAQGCATAAFKPVVSGFDEAAPQDSDPALLLEALGEPVSADTIARIAPWRFKAPLSPDMAAAREGRCVDVDALIAFSRDSLADGARATLIEGVGGIMVPLDARHTVLDWMVALRLPLVLVAGSYLGAISHALSALEVLYHRGCEVAATVISETADSTVPLADTLATLRRFADPVIALPRLRGTHEHPAFEQIARLL